MWTVTDAPGTHRVVPDGVVDLVWGDGELRFAGPDTGPDLVQYEKPTTVWGFRFAPGVAGALLGMPLDEVVNTRLLPEDIPGLPPRLLDAAHADPAAGLTAMVRALAARADVDRGDLRLAASLDAAARSGLTVAEAAARHHLSERSLLRSSRRLFGYGFKTLASVHRFQRGLALARAGHPLADAAARAGYADQAHLSREARRWSGTTIRELLVTAVPEDLPAEEEALLAA